MEKRLTDETAPAQPVCRDAVLWAFRYFIGREPWDETELAFHAQHPNVESLRRAMAGTGEFSAYMREIGGAEAYRPPLFLLQPPTDSRIPWRFEPPNLVEPVSQLCTERQLEESAFLHWCRMLDMTPVAHRKLWEFCFLAAAMQSAGVLRPGGRALGFGVGTEPLPALLAHFGLQVLATDAPSEAVHTQGWASTGQHAASLEGLYRPAIIPAEALERHVTFRPVDMNAIPADLRGFDVCWSSCAFEHLGSIEHGLRFFEASLETLKPGGLAVHTTEFNLSSNNETLDSEGLCIFRKRDIETLLGRLAAAGHRVWPLNLHPGSSPMDAYIDLPPFSLPHLKLEVGKYVTTSIGLAVQKQSV